MTLCVCVSQSCRIFLLSARPRGPAIWEAFVQVIKDLSLKIHVTFHTSLISVFVQFRQIYNKDAHAYNNNFDLSDWLLLCAMFKPYQHFPGDKQTESYMQPSSLSCLSHWNGSGMCDVRAIRVAIKCLLWMVEVQLVRKKRLTVYVVAALILYWDCIASVYREDHVCATISHEM